MKYKRVINGPLITSVYLLLAKVRKPGIQVTAGIVVCLFATTAMRGAVPLVPSWCLVMHRDYFSATSNRLLGPAVFSLGRTVVRAAGACS